MSVWGGLIATLFGDDGIIDRSDLEDVRKDFALVLDQLDALLRCTDFDSMRDLLLRSDILTEKEINRINSPLLDQVFLMLNVPSTDGFQATPLERMVVYNCIDACRYFSRTKLLQQDDDWVSLAASMGRLDLLKLGYRFEPANDKYYFGIACEYGQTHVMEWLLANNGQLWSQIMADIDDDDYWAFQDAIEAGHFTAAKLLLNLGYDQRRAMRSAVMLPTTELVRILLGMGFDIDSYITSGVDCDLHTPLSYAAFSGTIVNVKFLIERGAKMALDWIDILALAQERRDFFRDMLQVAPSNHAYQKQYQERSEIVQILENV